VVRARLFATLLALGLFTLPAAADPVAVSDNLVFQTEDQSMWFPGSGDLVNKPFRVTLVDIDTGMQTIGEVFELSTSIPNPAFLAWRVAFNACRLAFSDAVCRTGATLPFIGKVGGLGNAPPQTLTVELGKNGLAISYDIDIEAGLEGALVIDGGKVDVSYPTVATLQADKSSYLPGELVTLSMTDVAGIPTMATEFSDLDLSFGAWGSVDAFAALEAWVANQGGVLPLVDIDKDFEREIFGVSMGNSEVGLRLLGLDPIIVDTSGGLNLKTFSVKYPPAPPEGEAGPFNISLADFQLQIPDLDTPPNSTWDPALNTLTNTQLPIDRGIAAEGDLNLIGSGAGFHPTDFAKADIDLDGILGATQGVILGLSAGIPLVIGVEGNLLDLDLGAFFGIGQTMTFQPMLDVMLEFSEPVSMETSPGVFELFDSFNMTPGQPLSFIHPGGDLTVTPSYGLDNIFTNDTQLLISPVLTLQALQLRLSGLAAGLAGAAFNAALVHHVFPLGDPLAVAQMGNTEPFTLGGFNTIRGSDLVLSSAVAPVPEPGQLVLLAIGLSAAARWRRRRAKRPAGR
jgi:hypothetical protein